MRAIIYYFLVALGLTIFSGACDDDDDNFASILGQWRGDRASFQLGALGPGFTDDDFDTELEFREDGTLIVTDDGQSVTGTYTLEGDQLTISIPFNIGSIPLSDTYTVQELTEPILVISRENEGTIQNPDTGVSFSGTIVTTLYFDRLQ